MAKRKDTWLSSFMIHALGLDTLLPEANSGLVAKGVLVSSGEGTLLGSQLATPLISSIKHDTPLTWRLSLLPFYR